MKKLFFLLLCVASVFVSCEKKSETAASDSAKPKKLTVWCWDPSFNIYAMNEAAKIYKRDNPDVEFEVVEVPWEDLQQKLITSLSANDSSGLPDIALIQDNALLKNLTSFPGAFLSLDGKVDLSKFAQFKVGFGEVDGKKYSVPFDNGATATFLRRDIIEQAGLKVEDFNDITWDEFYALGKIVKEKTGYPLISYVGNEPDYTMIVLQSAGTWFFDENGAPKIADNEALKKGLQLYADMVRDGVCLAVTDWNAYVASLNNGSVASTVEGCWIIGIISSQSEQAGKWAMANTPRLSGVSGATNFSSQGGSSWVVLSSSKNADLAADFLNKTFAGSKELYETILPSSGAISTWLPAGDSSAYEVPNAFFGGQKIYADLLGYSAKIPQVKYGIFNYEARDATGVAVSQILQGKDVNSALQDAQKQVEFIMGY